MKEKWNYILYLVWFSYLILSAILMFGHGFLLSRKTLSDVSECIPLHEFGCDGRVLASSALKGRCSDDEKIRRIIATLGSPMPCAPKKHRVLFILVDALRYDFSEYNDELEHPLPYQNKLPVLRETLQRWPERTRLFRFMADPPTTTLQRVKALVTGSLPTFIDVGSNFAAMELHEDNFITQVVNGGGRAVLLGDDTWSRLIPDKWHRSHAQYSFHTWDLDTVDIEVDSKIYDEIKKDDWDLLVAHYLGVDHAGHRYGPNHTEMTRKLNETNVRLQKIIEMLPPDVLLYVVGDHGMTESDPQEWTVSGGDHGGESKAERTAVLFAYRGEGLWGEESQIENGKEVQQTDLTPSISAALGRPAPAPSLGAILMPVLPKMTTAEILLHYSNNLKQIINYLVRYGEESQQIPLDKLTELINSTRDQLQKAATVTTKEELETYINDVRTSIGNIRSVFREVWVEFDSISMLRALLLMFLAIFSNWLITEGIPMDRLPAVFASSFVRTGFLSIAFCIGLCVLGHYLQMFEDLEHAIILSTGMVSGVMVSTLIIMHWDGITQKWYEGRSQFYERFARAALVASAVVLLSNSYIIEEGAGLSYLTLSVLALMAWNTGCVRALALWVGCGIVLALSREYRGCREEQGDCWTAGGGVASGQASRVALVLALGCMGAVIATVRQHIGWRGHGVMLAGCFACAHWAVGWGSLGSPSRSRLLARGAWLAIITMMVLLWRKEGRGATLPLTVCGLLLYIANSLVLGAAYAPSAALALCAGFLALNIVSMLKDGGNSKTSIATRSNSSVACMWALMASYQFYGMGHHATLGHLRWYPAFHAGDPNYLPDHPIPLAQVVTGALVALDLFGMPLLFGATLPLLTLWGRGGAAVGARTQLAAVFALGLKFMLCFAIRVFAIAIAATIHCRHLMIWGVFTPKLLFESGACAAALVGTILGVILTARHLSTPQRNS